MRLPASTSRSPGSSHAALAAATHLGWTLNIGYGAGVLILGLLSTAGWAKNTAHDAIATPPDDFPAPAPGDHAHAHSE
jgi:hypothetical protein